MTLLGNLIPTPYDILVRIGVVLIVLGAAFGTGWVERGKHDQDKIDQAIIADQTKIIKIDHTQTIINNDLVNQLQNQINKLKTQNSNLQVQISKIPDKCVLSKDWVDIYNQSIVTPKETP